MSHGKATAIHKECGGVGKFQKGWDMVKKQQVKGGAHGETEETGKIKISLYKCQKCKKLFRQGEYVPNQK